MFSLKRNELNSHNDLLLSCALPDTVRCAMALFLDLEKQTERIRIGEMSDIARYSKGYEPAADRFLADETRPLGTMVEEMFHSRPLDIVDAATGFRPETVKSRPDLLEKGIIAEDDEAEKSYRTTYMYWYNRLKSSASLSMASPEKLEELEETFRAFRKKGTALKGQVQNGRKDMGAFASWLLEQRDYFDRLIEGGIGGKRRYAYITNVGLLRNLDWFILYG